MNSLKIAALAALFAVAAPSLALAGWGGGYNGGFKNQIGGYNDGKYVAAGGGAKGIAECKNCKKAETNGGSESGIKFDKKSVSAFSNSGMTSTTSGHGYNAATSDSYIAVGLGHGSGGVSGSAKWKKSGGCCH